MKVSIVGSGYVGLSLATLLAQKNEVVAIDVIKEKIDMINNRISPIKDNLIEDYFKNVELNLRATLDYEEGFKNANFIIICTPTNYDENLKHFDTSSVEDVIDKIIKLKLNSTIVIKSTIPIGFVDKIKDKYNIDNIFFSPEFLREGKALYDNLYPSRIIVGSNSEEAHQFANLLKSSSLKKEVPIKFMGNKEAEAIKLFANTYLALRVSYFNELDTFSEINNLNSKDIIEGVCLDDRIGNYYNNPSFGYGGYCLPKDTKQLLSNYGNIPQNLIEAIVKSNDTRKKHIANMILSKSPKIVGVYRLIMKNNSDNFRSSAIQDIMKILSKKDIKILIYEPTLKEKEYNGFSVISDLEFFKMSSDVILVNRNDKKLDDVKEKLYTRDIFNIN